MDLLNIYFKIFIVSLLNLGNTISATDLGVYNRLGRDIFYFNENGKEYSFMVLDFSVNCKKYVLSDNEKLKDLILKNIPENEIKTIKKEIIEASELDEDNDFKKKYTKLIDRVEVVQLCSTQVCNGGTSYVIKGKKGFYYSNYNDFLQNLNKFSGSIYWEESSYHAETIYVINDLIINNNDIDKQLELYAAVSTYEGESIAANLSSWCRGCNFRSFGTLHTDMDFKKLILDYYEEEHENKKVYAAYKAGYLNKTLDKFEAEFKQQLQLFIDNNTEYELPVELIKYHEYNPKRYDVYIKVRPNMTYGELLRAVIKKCREIEKLSDDNSSSIRDEYLWINDTRYEKFEDFVDLSKNDDKIMLDIEYLKFKYYIWKYFDPKKKEDMLWNELNGICKDVEEESAEEIPIENKSVEEEEQEENEDEKPVEQVKVEKPEDLKVKKKGNDKEPKEQKFTKKVKVNKLEEPKFNREGNGNEHEESKVKKDNINNNKEPVESKVTKKVKVNKLEEPKFNMGGKGNEPEEQEFKKKCNGNELEELKVKREGNCNGPEKQKVKMKGNGNEHVESKVKKKGGCCTTCC